MIGVYGGGAWGTALATMLVKNNKDAILVMRDKKIMNEVNQKNTNKKYLGNTKLPKNLVATNDAKKLKECDIVLVVVPAKEIINTIKKIKKNIQGKYVVLCAKGFNHKSKNQKNLFISQSVSQVVSKNKIAVMSGPSFASDVAKGLPTAVTIAANNTKTAQTLAEKISTKKFRVYVSDDIKGVEASGAIKNVYAIAVGIVRGLGLGKSAEAALIARGFSEMKKIVPKLGGKKNTTTGLAGLGDLILTCSSSQSRNFSYGYAIAKNKKFDKLTEGVETAKITLDKTKQYNINAPIVSAVVMVMEKKITPHYAVKMLLDRPIKEE